jgi:imidazolonepropionase-like amidohydrolase
VDFEETKAAAEKWIRRGAVVGGVAAGTWLAAHNRAVRATLTEPRRPFVWKLPRGRSVLLRGVDVVDVARGVTLRGRGILFRDGQISEVVSTRDLGKVEADRAFDCSGLTAIPGIINCHCHMLMPGASMVGLDLLLAVKRQALRNMEECVTHGVTTVRDAAGVVKVMGELARRAETMEILGPRVITCGPSLMAKGGYPDFARQLPAVFARKWGDLGIYVHDPESGRLAVRSAVEQGARFIKMFFDDRSLFMSRKQLNVPDDATVRAVVEEAHRLGRRVGVHQTQVQGFRRAVKLGVDDFEHVPRDNKLTDGDVSRFMKGDHYLTPTASVILALAFAPEGHPARSDPLVETLQLAREHLMRHTMPTVAEEPVARANFKLAELYAGGRPSRRFGSGRMVDNEVYVKGASVAAANVMKLYRAGAKVCVGNDGGTPMSFPGTLFTEMEIMEWIGIPRRDILKGATTYAAELLDMTGEIGSIEKGKLADIVLLSGNPLDDIRAVKDVEAVFRSGALLYRGYRFGGEGGPSSSEQG